MVGVEVFTRATNTVVVVDGADAVCACLTTVPVTTDKGACLSECEPDVCTG